MKKIMDVRGCLVEPIARGSALWQQAVNRQPGSRSDNSYSKSASLDRFVIFSKISDFFEISTKNVNFSKPLDPIELFPDIIISLFY